MELTLYSKQTPVLRFREKGGVVKVKHFSVPDQLLTLQRGIVEDLVFWKDFNCDYTFTEWFKENFAFLPKNVKWCLY
jgi:hypothetical protein